jgi:hypothetical protein
MTKLSQNRTFRLCDRQLDLELWQKLYYKYQFDFNSITNQSRIDCLSSFQVERLNKTGIG